MLFFVNLKNWGGLTLAGLFLLVSCSNEPRPPRSSPLPAALEYAFSSEFDISTGQVRLAAWTTSDFHQTSCSSEDSECAPLTRDLEDSLAKVAGLHDLRFEDNIEAEVITPHLPNDADYTFVWLGSPAIDGNSAQVDLIISSPTSRKELRLLLERDDDGVWNVSAAESPELEG